MVIGVGVDVCAIDRFARAIERPGVLGRVLTAAERDASPPTLAGRFAAKEALAKALGAPPGLSWTDCEVGKDDAGRPLLRVWGTVGARAAQLGISSIHLSISHDAGVAVAMVVCE